MALPSEMVGVKFTKLSASELYLTGADATEVRAAINGTQTRSTCTPLNGPFVNRVKCQDDRHY